MDLELDSRKLNYGTIAHGLTILAGIIYGIRTKRKFGYYLLLFLLIGPLVFSITYSAAPKTKS